jgi:hypothetical protein
MPDRDDKRARKEALDRWKAQQRAAARAKLPLPNEQMQALFDMLDTQLPRQACDHTLWLTQASLVAQGLPVDPVVTWLRENGGYCDCEALANAEEAWHDAIHDVDG